MNIYYMGENLNDSKFPIVVWNEQVVIKWMEDQMASR